MTLETWITFVVATAVLAVMPGPVVLLLVATSLRHGPKPGLATISGAAMAEIILLTLTVIGLATLLAIMAEWMDVIRWTGVAYLLYLAWKQWREPITEVGDVPEARPRYFECARNGFIAAVINPKNFLFFGAFFPAFVDVSEPVLPQLLVLSATFLVVVNTLDCGYVLLASHLRGLFKSKRGQKIRNRVAASFLGGTAAGIALTRAS